LTEFVFLQCGHLIMRLFICVMIQKHCPINQVLEKIKQLGLNLECEITSTRQPIQIEVRCLRCNHTYKVQIRTLMSDRYKHDCNNIRLKTDKNKTGEEFKRKNIVFLGKESSLSQAKKYNFGCITCHKKIKAYLSQIIKSKTPCQFCKNQKNLQEYVSLLSKIGWELCKDIDQIRSKDKITIKHSKCNQSLKMLATTIKTIVGKKQKLSVPIVIYKKRKRDYLK